MAECQISFPFHLNEVVRLKGTAVTGEIRALSVDRNTLIQAYVHYVGKTDEAPRADWFDCRDLESADPRVAENHAAG